MEFAEKSIRVSFKKNESKTKKIFFNSEYTTLVIPPLKIKKENILLGDVVDREDIYSKGIHELIIHIVNINGKSHSIQLKDQLITKHIKIRGFSFFYFEYGKLEKDIKIDVFLFKNKNHIVKYFSVLEEENGRIANMHYNVTGYDIYEAYRIGAIEVNGHDFTSLAKEFAQKYNISLKYIGNG